jgi:CRISPR system Cascade subunit CasA
VQFQVLGLQADQASPIKFFSERFSISIEFLKKRKLWDALRRAISISEEHQIVFQSKRGRPYYALAEVLKYDKASKLANSLDGESRYWAALDRAFPELLFKLPDDYETGVDGITVYGNKQLLEWTKTIQKAAEDAFTESIASIRNYEARAAALRSLSYHLAVLRGDIDPKAKKKSKAKAKAS